MPARLSFRLDLDQIAQAVQPDNSGQLNWQDDAAVFELLGQPIVFHRSLVDITGSATASLMLSHSVVQTVRILNKRPDGWFYKSRDEWHRETGLSRWEQETARKVLKELGVLEEKRTLEVRADQDAARVMYYRVNLQRLEEMLSKPEIGLDTNAEAERWEPGKQDCEKPAINKVGMGQTGLLITSNQQGGKPLSRKPSTPLLSSGSRFVLRGGKDERKNGVRPTVGQFWRCQMNPSRKVVKPRLAVIDGRVTATSLAVAEHFEKRHSEVLRAIKNLGCSTEFHEAHFWPGEYIDQYVGI